MRGDACDRPGRWSPARSSAVREATGAERQACGHHDSRRRANAPPDAEGIRFVLNQLTIAGVTVYPADRLRGVYAGLLHKEVTLAGISRIVDALTARYLNDGYILS